MTKAFYSNFRSSSGGQDSSGGSCGKRTPLGSLVLIVLLMICTGGRSYAQAVLNGTTYPMTLSNGVALQDMTGATTIFANGFDDNVSALTDFGPGFSFRFMGKDYTQFAVCVNGFIRLGGTNISGSTWVNTNFDASNVGPLICPRWDDLATGTNGWVKYKVAGTAPNRIGIFEWFITVPYNTTAAANATYQCLFYEGTGRIQYIYGAVPANSTDGGYTIALKDTVNALPQFGAVTPNATWTSSTISYTTTSNANSIAIAAGSSIEFIPVAPPSPANLVFSGVGAVGMTLSWDDVAGETGYKIYRSTDGINYTLAGSTGANVTTFVAGGLSSSTTYFWRVTAAGLGAESAPLSGSQATSAGVLCGTYSVGPTGAYPSLTAAFNDLAAQGVSCAVILELQAAYLSSVETFPINVRFYGGSPINNVIVRPEAGATGLLIQSSNGWATINDSTGTYVTFDGRPGGAGTTSELTIWNTSATTSGHAFRFVNDASNNTLRYLKLRGVNTSASGGVIIFGGTTLTTGNDNNLIENCEIFDGATTPANCLYSSGTANKTNDNNVLSNNLFYNFFSATVASKGMYVTANNNSWVITNNRVFQTAARTYTTGNTHKGIHVDGGNGYTITSNTIGYGAADGTGTMTLNGTVSTNFNAMDVSLAGTTPVSTVANNRVGGITLNTASTLSGVPFLFAGIYVNLGAVNLIGNYIGDTLVNGSITISSTGSGGKSVGIFNASSAVSDVTMVGNTVGGITISSPTLSAGGSFSALGASGSIATTNVRTISGNVVGGSLANSISLGSVGSTGTWSFTGLENSSFIRSNISQNRIENVRIITRASAGQLIGMTSSSGIPIITNNIIRNMTTSSRNTSTSSSSGVIGITMTSTSTLSGFNTQVIGNQVYNLSNTSDSASVWVVGINYSGSTTTGFNHEVSKNTVYGLTLANGDQALTASIIGINSSAGIVTIKNNMVTLGAGVANANAIVGISKASSAINNIWHNSVYIGGTSTVAPATPNNSTAFRRTTTGVDDVRNNIFYNARINSGIPGTAPINAAVTLNGTTTLTETKNILFCDTLNGGAVGILVSTSYKSLPSWRTATSLDLASIFEDPKYIAPTASTPDLHIQAPPVLTPVELAGVLIASVTDDFDSQARSGLTPVDIGADAGNFAPSGDFVPPVIYSSVYSPVGAQCVPVSRPVTVVTNDPSGIASVKISWSLNGVAQTQINLTNTVDSTWTGSIPASGSAVVVFSVTVTDASVNSNFTTTGTSTYQDQYLAPGFSAGADQTICPNTNVTLAAASPLLGKVLITEVLFNKGGTGDNPNPLPYITGTSFPDMVELTNLSSVPVNMGGYQLIILGEGARSFTLPSFTLAAGAIAVLHAGTGTDNASLNFYNMGGTNDGIFSSSLTGYVLRSPSNQVVDVVATNGYNPVGQVGVVASDWSGSTPSTSGRAGIIRTPGDNNTAADWQLANTPSPILSIGSMNAGLIFNTSVSVTWNPGAFTGPVYTTNVASPTTFIATISDGTCSFNDTVQVNTFTTLGAVTTHDSIHCGTNLPNFYIDALPGATLYHWYSAATGGTLLQSSSSLTFTSTISATQTLYVAAFDGTCDGPRTAITETVTVPDAINATINGLASVSICSGETVNLAVSSSNANYVYTWTSTAGGGLNSTTGSSVTALPGASGYYIVSALDASTNCSTVDTVFVTVKALPVVNATATPSTICQYGATQLSAGTGAPIVTYNISTIPATLIAVPPSAVQSVAGDDAVGAVTIPFPFTFNGVTTQNAYVFTNGFVQFGSNTGFTTTYGQTLPSTADPNNLVAVVWEDLNPAANQIRHFTVGSPGTRQFVVDYNGVQFWSASGYIRAQMILNEVDNSIDVIIDSINFAGNSAVVGVENSNGTAAYVPAGRNFSTWGATVQHEGYRFTPAVLGNLFTYLWSPATDLSATNTRNVTLVPTTPGNPTYTVVATDLITGCSNTSSVSVTVTDAPEAPVCVGDTICGQGIATVTATGTGGDLIWTGPNGGNILATGNSFSSFVTTGGSYKVRELPAGMTNSYIGYNPVTVPSAAVGYFPTSQQGLWFRVSSGSGVIIDSVDIIPNGPIGSNVTIVIQDTLGNLIGSYSTVTTVTNVGTGGPFNVQTIPLKMYVPYSANLYQMRPVQNPNLAVHQNGTVSGTYPWQVPNEIQIMGYGDLTGNPGTPPSIFGNTTFGFFYNWRVRTGCIGQACTATYIVNPAPPLSITANGSTSFCGTGSVQLTAGGDPSYVNFSWTPATGLSSTNTAVVTASPTVTTTYIVVGNDGGTVGCANSDTITITVNPAPFADAGTSPSDTICISSSFTLNGSGGSPSYKQVGTVEDAAQVSGGIFNGANLAQKTQMLVTAAELNAAGLFGPSFLNSVGFKVSNKLSTQPYSNFTVTVKTLTTPGCFSTVTHETGGTTVFSGSYSTVLGWNDIVFTTPFAWDGVSDIAITTCFTNTTTSFFDMVYVTNTPGCNSVRTDNAAACGVTTGTMSGLRPNMRFSGGIVNYSWSPAAGLSATNIANPVFTPTAVGQQQYVLSVTDPSTSCVATDTLRFYVNSAPKAPVAEFATASNICLSGTIVMHATFVDGSLQWQQSSDGVNFSNISGATSSTYTSVVLTDTAWFRVYAYCQDTTYSNILFVPVFAPAIIGTQGDTVCGEGTVTATASANPNYFVQWYSDSLGTQFLTNGNSYSTYITETDTVWVTSVADTNNTGVNSCAKITEITQFSGGTGSGPLPAYVTPFGDYLEITNTGSTTLNLTGYQLERTTSSPFVFTFPNTVLAPGAVLVLNMGFDAAFPDIPNVYYNTFTSGFSDLISSGQQMALILSYQGTVVDVLATNGLNPVGLGSPAVQAGDWSGVIPSNSGLGGTGRTGSADNNSASDWVNSDVVVQSIGVMNPGLTINSGACSSCRSASYPVVLVATTPPAVAISATDTTLCFGESTTLSATSANTNYVYTWNPGSGSGSSFGVTPTVTTEYLLVATDNVSGCVATETFTVTVNELPGLNGISQNPTTVCGGTPVTLTALTAEPGLVTIGNGTIANSASTYPTPFGAWYESAKTQYLIRASELIAAGITSGPMTSLAFDVSSLNGSGVHTDYTVSLAQTSVTDLSAGYVTTGFTTVFGPTNYTPVAGVNNLTFAAPFVWNGTSNIVVNICHANDPTGAGGILYTNNATVNASPVGFAATRWQNQDNVDICGGTGSVTEATVNERVNISFNAVIGTGVTAYSWSTGATTQAITFTPPNGSSTYTVTVFNSAGCSVKDSITINASEVPKPVVSPTTDTTLCFGTIINLFAVDTGAFSGGYPAGTTVDWINIVNGLPPTTPMTSDNGSFYQVRVTLPSGCQALSSVRTVITKATATNTVVKNPTCGAVNGSIKATVTNGVAPFRFLWKDGLGNVIKDTTTSTTNTDSIYNLVAGNYTLEVVDSFPYGCSSGVIPFTLTAGTPPVANLALTPATCPTDFASLLATATGGTGAYTYLWENSSTSPSRSGLGSGTYTVTVTDAVGCTDDATITVTNPAPFVGNVTSTGPTCAGGSNGTLSSNVTGGTQPYAFADWFSDDGLGNFTPVGSNGSATGLPAGDYVLFIEDANGCQEFINYTINDPAPLALSSFTPTSGPTGTAVTITGVSFTAASVTGVSFNGTSASFTVVNGTTITTTVPAGATSGTITLISPCGNVTSTGTFTVTTPTFATFNLHALVEGYYLGSGQMTNVLLNQGVSVSATESDSMRVELRDPLSPTTMLASGTSVMNNLGFASYTFPSSLIGQNAYIVLIHRNGVETWSALPVTVSSTFSYDFTTAATQAFGDNMRQMATGIYAIFSGDINRDYAVDGTDFLILDFDIQNFGGGWVPTDLNGDGSVDGTDFLILDANIQNFVGGVTP